MTLQNSMDDSEIGTLILSSKNLDSSVNMPEIPIKPNRGIPKTIGIFLILGGLIVSVAGLSQLSAQYLEINYEDQIAAYELLGIDISLEELEKLELKYKQENYYLISGILLLLPGIILIIGGIQLFLCKKYGVYTSLIGGITLFILNLYVNWWGSSIDTEIGISIESQWDTVESAMCTVCNLFCITLPLIPYQL